MPDSKSAPEGWFSRRHQTRDVHDASVEAWKNKKHENKAPKGPR